MRSEIPGAVAARAGMRLREVLADPWLVGAMVAGLAIRLLLAWLLDAGQVPRGDEINYLARAEHFAATGELTTGPFVRPPLYFVLLAGVARLADAAGLTTTLATKWLQSLVAVATAVPVYRTARRVGGRRVARWAAAILLFDPTLVAYAHLIWPETVFLALVSVIFDRLGDDDAPSTPQLALLGLLAGLALLLKPVFGLFCGMLAVWWWRRVGARAALQRVLVVGGVAALVIAPWVIRNQMLYGPSIVLENQGPYNLWIGNDPRPAKQILDRWRALEDPVVRARVATSRGLAAIGGDPARFARASGRRVLNLWGLEFFVVRLAIIGEYGDVSRSELLALFWLIQAITVAVLLAAAAGVGRAARDPLLRLVLLYALVFTLLVSAMVATTRFRVPFALPICVCAALGVERLRTRAMSARSWAAVAVAAGVLAFSSSRPVFRKLATGDFAAVEELDVMEWRFFRY